jgi:hypothetical protein
MTDSRHPSLVTRHLIPRLLLAAGLALALAGCGIVNWSVSNGSDGCPRDTRSTVPCS